jgi:hypothetical protein
MINAVAAVDCIDFLRRCRKSITVAQVGGDSKLAVMTVNFL